MANAEHVCEAGWNYRRDNRELGLYMSPWVSVGSQGDKPRHETEH